ncbi:WxL domain-containing protein [Enterococcus rotai]|uniref:WxL domain-containing protein n=1 Tax=Enterococcus rotai TaxID=118060 RepID=UPI0032B401FE
MKKLVMMSLLSATALMLFAPKADAKSFEDKTDVGVSFKSDDPTIPGENKPYKNNLSLVWKPSSFQFGEQKSVGASATFSNTVAGNQYLIVNDDRQAASTPWSLNVKLSEMTTADASKKLASKLMVTLNDAQKYDIGTEIGEDNDFVPNKPDATSLSALDANAGITLGDGKVKTLTVEAGNTTGQAVLVKKTANDIKGGVSTLISGVKLVVTDAAKDGAAGETFAGKVTWTLDDLQP